MFLTFMTLKLFSFVVLFEFYFRFTLHGTYFISCYPKNVPLFEKCIPWSEPFFVYTQLTSDHLVKDGAVFLSHQNSDVHKLGTEVNEICSVFTAQKLNYTLRDYRIFPIWVNFEITKFVGYPQLHKFCISDDYDVDHVISSGNVFLCFWFTVQGVTVVCGDDLFFRYRHEETNPSLQMI